MKNKNKFILPILISSVLFSTHMMARETYIHEVSDQERYQQIQKLATIVRMEMVPMRDGKKLATRLYIPKKTKGPVPAVFWRTPYNVSEHLKGNPNRPSAYLKFVLDAIQHGYAFILQNERGKYFSEGEWEILGFPRTDGYDALTWISQQPWSNGKVATLGCSSSAEWQMALASKGHPAHAAAIPMAYGAGVGKIGEYYEQGNMYRGGAIQKSMVGWMYTNQNTQRPMYPPNLPREDLIRLAKYNDLSARPRWLSNDDKAFWHLPMSEMYEHYDGPKGAWDEMARRHPADAAWKKGGLYHEDEDYKVPTLWVSSWYDLSTAPNIEIVNHIIANATDKWVRDQQYMIIAPTTHCGMYRLRNPLIVGERSMGKVDFAFDKTIWSFFDYYTKGKKNKFKKKTPKVRYFTMGSNEWQDIQQWPPKNTRKVSYYLSSNKGANTLKGDGRLTTQLPTAQGYDQFTYDPLDPVPSLGGNLWGSNAGSYDNREIEKRDDVLVYTTEAFTKDTEVTGKIEINLYVSSDAKDTDFTVKLLDVYPDGRAYNLDETIQRVRYREGYDREVFMQAGKIYPLKVSAITTSNVFLAGHRLRIEVSSSNFPRFQRNLNLGTDNFTEKNTKVAKNKVYHSPGHASNIVVPIVQ